MNANDKICCKSRRSTRRRGKDLVIRKMLDTGTPDMGCTRAPDLWIFKNISWLVESPYLCW